MDVAALLSSLGSKGVIVDMSTYVVNVVEDVRTCRGDTADSITEEVLEVYAEGILDDEDGSPEPVSCYAAVACLNSLMIFFSAARGHRNKSLWEMASFGSARQFVQKWQTFITDWLEPSERSN